jgi:hypothetical protein
MRHDDLDRILSGQQDIVPSSGFVASVMDAVRSEASTPPPIPFPWKRALPGLAAACFALGWVLVTWLLLFSRRGASPPKLVEPAALTASLEAAMNSGVGWVVLALLLALASVKLTFRLARL